MFITTPVFRATIEETALVEWAEETVLWLTDEDEITEEELNEAA